MHIDGPAGRNEYGGDDNVMEWRLTASTGGVGLRDGGRTCAEGAIGTRPEIEVEGGNGVVDPDDFTGQREDSVIAIDMGGEGGTHGGDSVGRFGGGSIGERRRW